MKFQKTYATAITVLKASNMNRPSHMVAASELDVLDWKLFKGSFCAVIGNSS